MLPRILLPLCAVALLACGDNESCDQPLPQVVTYTSHIKALVDGNCLRCHSTALIGPQARSGAPAELNYNEYQGIADVATTARTRINLKTMPPDQPLNVCDRALFTKWVDDGIPQ